jgi:hypothetical protein
MRKTINGGTTWTTVTPTGYYVTYPHIDNVPGTASMWVDVSAGPGIGSSYSNNDCSSFLNIDTGSVQYTTVTFYDLNTGWAGGFNVSASDGGIYKWNSSVIVGKDDPAEIPESIDIYPNPSNGTFTINLSHLNTATANIEVYNLLGELVFSEQAQPLAVPIHRVDLNTIQNGIYMVNIKADNTYVTQKISIFK